jgi:hypothetical protein
MAMTRSTSTSPTACPRCSTCWPRSRVLRGIPHRRAASRARKSTCRRWRSNFRLPTCWPAACALRQARAHLDAAVWRRRTRRCGPRSTTASSMTSSRSGRHRAVRRPGATRATAREACRRSRRSEGHRRRAGCLEGA